MTRSLILAVFHPKGWQGKQEIQEIGQNIAQTALLTVIAEVTRMDQTAQKY